jgi:hypothetical protein
MIIAQRTTHPIHAGALMATKVFFKRRLTDAAKLEAPATVALGTTGFKGDGDRLFLQWNDTGILLDHDSARAFLEAAGKCAEILKETGACD